MTSPCGLFGLAVGAKATPLDNRPVMSGRFSDVKFATVSGVPHVVEGVVKIPRDTDETALELAAWDALSLLTLVHWAWAQRALRTRRVLGIDPYLLMTPIGAGLRLESSRSLSTCVLFPAGRVSLKTFQSQNEPTRPFAPRFREFAFDIIGIVATCTAFGVQALDLKAENLVVCNDRSRLTVRAVDIGAYLRGTSGDPSDPMFVRTGRVPNHLRTTPTVRGPLASSVGPSQALWSVGAVLIGILGGGNHWSLPASVAGRDAGHAQTPIAYANWSAMMLAIVGGTPFSERFTGDVDETPELLNHVKNCVLQVCPRLAFEMATEIVRRESPESPAFEPDVEDARLERMELVLDLLAKLMMPYAMVACLGSEVKTVEIPSPTSLLHHPLFD